MWNFIKITLQYTFKEKLYQSLSSRCQCSLNVKDIYTVGLIGR